MKQITRLLRGGPFAVVAVLICAGHVASVLFLGMGVWGSMASNLLQLAAAATAFFLCLDASRRSTGFARRVWALVASSFAIWCVTQAVYSYQRDWMGGPGSEPSWTEFLFRLYRAPWLMALLIVPGEEKQRGPNWQQRLDFAQVGILFLFFYFNLYFVPGSWQRISPHQVGGFLELSDLENWLLCATFIARARLSHQLELRTLYQRLVLYLLVYAAGSSLSNYSYAFWNATPGHWTDVAFSFSLATGGLLAASWQQGSSGEEPGAGLAPVVYWAPAILPSLTVALALPVAQSAPGAAALAIFGSIACFGGRLIITLKRQERLLEALRSSEARYGNLVQMAPDAILVHVEGRITFANPTAVRAFGVPDARNLVGRHVLDFTPPELRGQVAKDLAGLGADPSARRWTFVRPDGVRVPLDAVGMALPPRGGEAGPPSRLVIARDVTALERAEAERETSIHNLEAKNAELERLTYTISHDLRSPLITVAGFLSYIEDAASRGDMASVRSDIERIRLATRKMDLLLRDLLDLSGVGRILASIVPIPFEPLCQEAIDLSGSQFLKGPVRVEIEPGLPVVLGDRARLIEAVRNLLENAAKFMGDQPDPVIQIGARSDYGKTVLFIRDNGIGIEPRHHTSIFGLLDKLDQQAEGSGVGLALVKRVIELHSGRIWVESEGTGAGATFCFTLPLAPDPTKSKLSRPS